MNKSILKTISILILAFAVLFSFATPVFAEETQTQTQKTETTDFLNPDNIIPADDSGAQSSVQNIAGAILAIVQTVAISVAVIMLVVLAIKYISAAPNDKAEIKKHAVVYIVGAVVLFSATGILEIIKRFATNIEATETAKEEN
ncbi:MAG: hypothetical protein J6J60_06680 [Clostridia bacterium]|nr:hypothetical protein [Clostridia bacterium]